MEVDVVLSSEEILRGLKHYRRIAKQDLLLATEEGNPESIRRRAEARRAIYANLSRVAEEKGPAQAVREALKIYQELPFVNGRDGNEHAEVKGQEDALENFFLMVGLQPKLRRQVRSQRPALG